MSNTFYLKVKEARKQSGLTLKQICEGIPVSTGHLNEYENGKTEMSGEKLISVCRKLGIDFGIEPEGLPVSKSTRTIPIISKTQAGDYGYWEDCYPVGAGIGREECPADITDPHAFAFLVEGDSMYPCCKHGNRVIVDTTREVHNGDEVVVKLTNGKVMVKVYKRHNGIILLESYNQAIQETIPVKPEDIECCFVVVCVKK